MAELTTRSGFATRLIALKVELAELQAGGLKLAGGLDAGSATNKDAAHGAAKRCAREVKDWQAAGASALIGKLTE
jgi:hypothetical protein